MEPAEPLQSENQPEKPTQTEEERFQEMTGIRTDFKEELNKKTEETNKNIASLKEGLKDNNKNIAPIKEGLKDNKKI